MVLNPFVDIVKFRRLETHIFSAYPHCSGSLLRLNMIAGDGDNKWIFQSTSQTEWTESAPAFQSANSVTTFCSFLQILHISFCTRYCNVNLHVAGDTKRLQREIKST